jgi:hypothetical protein
MSFNDSLFSFLELCLVAVMPVAVACVIDAMVCICVGSYEVLNGLQSFMTSLGNVRQNFHVFKFIWIWYQILPIVFTQVPNLNSNDILYPSCST